MCQLFLALDVTSDAIALLSQFFAQSKTKPLKHGYGIVTRQSSGWVAYKSTTTPVIDTAYNTIVESNIIIAHLRQIYTKNMTAIEIKNEQILTNTQAFNHNNIYFMHHGDLFIRGSNEMLRFQQSYMTKEFQTCIQKLKSVLSKILLRNIHGNTDSELIFHIFLHFFYAKDKPEKILSNILTAWRKTLKLISDTGFQTASNFAIVIQNYVLFSNVYHNSSGVSLKQVDLYVSIDEDFIACSSKIIPSMKLSERNRTYVYNILSKNLHIFDI
jgi:predicted glutamine amidotransferase